VLLGNVLVNDTVTGSGTLTNTGLAGSGSAAYATSVTGSVGATPLSGTLAQGGSQVLTITGTAGSVSGSNSVLGTVAAANNSNTSGSAAPVSVEANVYNVAQVTPGANGQTLANTGTGNLVASAQVQSISINNASTQNSGAWTTATPTIASGSTGTVASFNTANRLNGTYEGSATIQVGNVAVGGGSISGASTGDVLSSSTYAISAAVSGNTSNARSNVYSAQILSGSSYAGYSLGSSVAGTTHISTGTGGKTQALLSYGTASASAPAVSMSFDSVPVTGTSTDDAYRTSDILTLTGVAQTGTRADGVVLTDEYVLQLTYDMSAAGLEYIAQNVGSGLWVNAVSLNSNNLGNTGSQFGNNALQESYLTYLDTTSGSDSPALGTYGYDSTNHVAWAVLNHTATGGGLAEFAVIPEPGTYAMIFSGFGLLAGLRRVRRRRSQGE
jgi:hypothetical protein